MGTAGMRLHHRLHFCSGRWGVQSDLLTALWEPLHRFTTDCRFGFHTFLARMHHGVTPRAYVHQLVVASELYLGETHK